MSIETEKQFEGMKAIGQIVANCLELMKSSAQPGMRTEELDLVGAKFLEEYGANSAPIKMYNFPGSTCISVEHEGVHGVPGPQVLKEGDLINIDVSAELNGFFADTGGSFVLGQGCSEKQNLCLATRRALKLALKYVSHGKPINLMGKEIEKFAHKQGLSVIENLGGHGVGNSLHEEPEFIANFFVKKDNRIFKENSVVAIEPIISTGARILVDKGDGWTLHHPHFFTAQFEHTVMVTKGRPFIFTKPTIKAS
ncbi:MAG: type I methionyl aminopeptidase [Bdellovibrionales bacterium]|nr:type I methionyl aminopeptidase [Bdellovibrionales bacterium]